MTVPVPPPPDPRQRRYTTATIRRARELHDAGWQATAIIDILERETGVRPAYNTVLGWLNESYAESLRRFNRESAARRRNGVTPEPPRPDFTDDELWRLRVEDGLTHTAISTVARRFYGVEISPSMVRHHLSRLGAPKNPNKARAGREVARRKAAA